MCVWGGGGGGVGGGGLNHFNSRETLPLYLDADEKSNTIQTNKT